ncbi:MAG: TRAP transporter large permease subunit, partial [Gammaproteobacteria bacterium]
MMIIALTSGFPVAFALPGAAIISISLAALSGYLIEGDVNAYFVQDGPVQWLTAGVTNFRSLYWDVERDTLIAIPLFVFMGIMLQRSKIAEDLLVTMAQLFGPIPGGLGISVVFVGALLAATTGIVGATVIAMGLISLPAMLRHNYSKPLACGTICASGTLGQIIPPSIVLIILADQLSSAADQASSLRKAEYKEITGEFSMPSHLDITSASAGDMFMGALIPGLILVGIYMLYILVVALLNPKKAPPVPFEGEFDRQFALKVFLALVPPLTLIFIVLGSIIAGIATVNQAGAIGAVGAMIMGSYRLAAGRKSAYYPAILAVVSIALMGITLSLVDINVKSIDGSGDWVAIFFAGLGTVGLMTAAAWAAIRAYRTNDTLAGVMNETAKTTSMVFIILIGAAMLTAAFRGFGGEELVKHFLTGLPGGFWTQFIVVMLVIFLLGFFLDFIEIAVVVVPIVAPILLMNPEANITAVWLGVMVGLNIQTSFLTPPFGFSLFYLRGVAPPEVKTLQIYKGAAAFIVLQLVGLTIAGAFPPLVNYLPYRTALTSETAPPPINPRLQACLEDYVFDLYDQDKAKLEKAIEDARALDLAVLPKSQRQQLEESLKEAAATFGNVAAVRGAESDRLAYAVEYKPLHTEVRRQQLEIRRLSAEIDDLKQNRTHLSREQ